MAGNGPPENLPASELWTLLEAMPRPSEVLDFPRKMPGTDQPVGQIRMWVLTQQDQIVCAAEADRAVKTIFKDKQASGDENIGYRDAYQNEVTVQILYRACRDANDVQRSFFPTPKDVRKLTVDEIGVLARLYLQVQAKLGPIIAWMTPEEERAWIGRLAEGGTAFPIALLSQGAQEALLISMASQLASSWTGTSSAGSLLAGPSNATPENNA